jgi:hypothetical protein
MSAYVTQPFNYTPFGTGLGLLAPFLAKWFGGNSNNPSTGTPTQAPPVPSAPGAMAATNNMASGAAGAAAQPSQANLAAAASLFPGAAASDLPAYIAANPSMFPSSNAAAPATGSTNSSTGGLANALANLGTGTGAATNPATSDRPYTLGPAVTPSPQGGGGPNAGGLQAMNTLLQSRMMPMNGGAPGVGNAGGVGQQQLLAMLMSRLGTGGGLG